MNKYILILLLVISVSVKSQIYYSNSTTSYTIYGLNTDTKPSNPPSGSFYVETNTGNIYYASGGVWKLPTKQKTIKSASDFPAAVSGNITLEDSTSYIINGTVVMGTDKLIAGVKSSIIGIDKANDILTYTGTGTFITMDNTTINKSTLFISNLGLNALSGTMFSVTASTARGVIVIDNVNLKAAQYGTLNNIVSLSMRTSSILNTATNGFVFTGTNTQCFIYDNQFRLNVGTVFNFGTSVFTNISISRNLVDEATTQTFISGTTGSANVTNTGHVTNNIFSGAGSFVSTITVTDALWNFRLNVGTTNTPISIAEGGTNSSTAGAARAALGLVIGTDVLAPNGSGAALTGIPTGSGTTSGTNTGDNATNTQYSGLAASKVNVSDTASMLTNYLRIPGSTSITTLGTIVTGTWNGAVVTGRYGGTGINNNGRTLTLNTNSGTFDFTGANKTLTIPLDASVSGTNTGDNAVNSLYSGLVSNAAHTGDATGSTALTLATVNSNVGSFGSATQVPNYTVNAKGLITAAANTSIQIAESQVTNLVSDLAAKAPSVSPSFTTPVIGVATGTSLAVSGLLTSSSPTAGIGYSTGAGGVVSQITNRSAGVTINKISGAITTNNTSLAAAAEATFIVTNSTVAVGDVILLSARSGQTANTSIPFVTAVANGSFSITLSNFNASTADTGAMIINFIVLKSVSN